jgi:hypothetical protein
VSCFTGFVSDNWSVKAIHRKTTETGRMRYLHHMPRRFKTNFRGGKLLLAICLYIICSWVCWYVLAKWLVIFCVCLGTQDTQKEQGTSAATWNLEVHAAFFFFLSFFFSFLNLFWNCQIKFWIIVWVLLQFILELSLFKFW